MSKGFAPTLTQGKNRPKTLEASTLSQHLKDCFAAIKDPRVVLAAALPTPTQELQSSCQ